MMPQMFTGTMPGDWDRRAACKGRDMCEDTRSTGRSAPRKKALHAATLKRVCAFCPVLDACRRWALTEPDPVPGMVAGGLTTAERDQRRRT